MIDLHSHILPGLDDGAQTIEDARDLALTAAEDGVTAIAATPHVRADYPTTADEMEAGVEELRRDFTAHGIEIEVLHGGELDLDRLSTLEPDELRRFTFAQNGRYALVEFPYSGWPLSVDAALWSLRGIGVVPVFAHPERNRAVQERPERLAELVQAGGAVQVTAASLDGRIGRSARATAEKLLRMGIVHVLASDAHTPEIREAGLARAAEAVGDPGLARFLTEEAPEAIVAGDPLPRPPEAARRRFGIRRRPG